MGGKKRRARKMRGGSVAVHSRAYRATKRQAMSARGIQPYIFFNAHFLPKIAFLRYFAFTNDRGLVATDPASRHNGGFSEFETVADRVKNAGEVEYALVAWD